MLNEMQLIQEMKKGSETAYQQMMNKYGERVFNLCYKYVSDIQEAEDLRQEVFIEVFRSIHKFRGDAKLSTWMHRIAQTKSLELIRYKERKKRGQFFQSTINLEDPSARKAKDPNKNPHRIND